MPLHCLWPGVFCCGPQGILGPLPGPPFGGLQLQCPVVWGVSVLWLQQFGLTGTLPQSSASWTPFSTSLVGLMTAGNPQLGGPLPSAISSLTALNTLRMSGCSFTGTIPVPWFSMSSLQTLDVSKNSLTGTIPGMANLTSLVAFIAGHNNMEGTIPQDWSNGPALTVFSMENNGLVGTLPAIQASTIEGVTAGDLQILLSNNRLSGTVPATLSMLRVSHIRVTNNSFVGPLTFMSFLSSAFTIALGNNQFTGTLPPLMVSTVQTLYINDNMLTGSLPPLQLPTLIQANFENNNFSGQFPLQLNLINCHFLELDGNNFTQQTMNSQAELLPAYFQFNTSPSQQFLSVNGTWQCIEHASHKPLNTGIIIASVVTVGLFLFTLVATFLMLQRKELSTKAIKQAGPPGAGKQVTLVCTDVEGSTELWEWDKEAMDEAQAQHDRIMRSQLSHFCGYEVATEGDAFTLAFHDPLDAVAWAISMQQALVTAKWPEILERNRHSCIRLKEIDDMIGFANHEAALCSGQRRLRKLGEASDVSLGSSFEHCKGWMRLDQVEEREILHRGLSVRMAIASGLADDVQANMVSRRIEYHGHVSKVAKALVDVPNGGQILMDGKTYAGISSSLVDLQKMILPAPFMQQKTRPPQALPRQSSLPPRLTSVMTTHTRTASMDESALSHSNYMSSLSLSPTSPSSSLQMTLTGRAFLMHMNRDSEAPDRIEEHEPAESSPRLVDTHNADASQSDRAAAITDGEADRKGSLDAASRSMASNAFRGRFSLNLFQQGSKGEHDKGQEMKGLPGESQNSGVIIIDMGTHVLSRMSGSHLIVQVVVPGLEERAFSLVQPTSLTMQPGYFDAPATLYCPIGRKSMRALLPSISMVFCAIDGMQGMKEANNMATEHALSMYRDQVRRCLSRMQGYECQEADGEFMLAFTQPLLAVQFCLLVQEQLMEAAWDGPILALPNCQVEIHDDVMIWCGPRVRMGVCVGEPASVSPHMTSGRADYFGPLVNRAARFCFSAANGGQIMMPLSMAQQLVHEWSGQEMELDQYHDHCMDSGQEATDPLDDLSEPPLLAAAVARSSSTGTISKKPSILSHMLSVRRGSSTGAYSLAGTEESRQTEAAHSDVRRYHSSTGTPAEHIRYNEAGEREPTDEAAEREKVEDQQSGKLPSLVKALARSTFNRATSIVVDARALPSQRATVDDPDVKPLQRLPETVTLIAHAGSGGSGFIPHGGSRQASASAEALTKLQKDSLTPASGGPKLSALKTLPHRELMHSQSRVQSDGASLEPAAILRGKQVQIHHEGIFQFKGLSEAAIVTSINFSKWFVASFIAGRADLSLDGHIKLLALVVSGGLGTGNGRG
ncbi:hypothetical protein WJX73_010556 [Symbiochloris irregularis]|uniref:Guanylate cyclase domain-containing protein n=1 Tax=Symbiochloris irregularis TaxID=706552 RepID=A0AAW1NYI1_9CHLO